MFKVDRDARGSYTISIGTGKTLKAHSLIEVAYALQHYYHDKLGIMEENHKPFDYQEHIKHGKECGCCPFCRQMQKEGTL